MKSPSFYRFSFLSERLGVYTSHLCLTMHSLIHYLQKFTDTEDLFLHHRNNCDTIMRTRLADFPLNSGFIVCLLLIGLRPHIGRRLVSNFTDYLSTVESDFPRIYSTLYFHLQAHSTPNPNYSMLLTEFLTDPVRAGEYVLDGPKYALVARFLLDCFIRPRSEPNFILYGFFLVLINEY